MTSTWSPCSCCTSWLSSLTMLKATDSRYRRPAFQYVGFRARVTVPPLTQDFSTNGPVPIGAAKKAAAVLPCNLFGTIELANAEISEISGAHGCFRVTTTSVGLVALAPEMTPLRKLNGPLLSRFRSSENATSCAVRADPSENFTPLRMAKVYVLPSADTV